MDPANMDYTTQHPDHHHPHYQQQHHTHHHHHHHHHPTGGSSSAAANRCPALRAAAGQRNFQFSNASSTRGTEQYDPVHGHMNRNMWQSRSPQHWRPAMITPFAQDLSAMGALPAPVTAPSQPPQSSFPACPVSSVPETHSQNQSFSRYGNAMLPAPRLQGQPSFDRLGGFQGPNPSQSNTQNPLRPLAQRTNTSLPSAASLLAGSPAQVLPPNPSTTFRQAGQATQATQATSFGNENSRPGQQPASFPHISMSQSTSQSFPRQMHDPISQATAAFGNSSPAPQPPSVPPSTAPQRNNDHTTRILNPVDIRRATVGALNRSRRRNSGSPSGEWVFDNGHLALRRGGGALEYLELRPVLGFAEGEGSSASRFARNGPSKRVASRRALASLQSVNIADLPEGERTCVICYNDFGVANPEGVNEAPLRLPKCKHVFGDHCIKKWFQESDSCPICRDKVHSELQPVASRRNQTGNRLSSHHIATQHHYDNYMDVEHEQMRLRDLAAMGSDSSTPAEVYDLAYPYDGLVQFTRDRLPTGSFRAENLSRHPMRQPLGPGYDRRSPPISDLDRRRRPRQRARNAPSSTRGSTIGSYNSNGVLHPSIPWSHVPHPNPLTEQPTSNAYDPSFENLLQPHLITPPDDYLQQVGMPVSQEVLAGNQSSGLPQMRSDAATGDFPSPSTPTGTFDIPMANSDNGLAHINAIPGSIPPPNLYTSYQQS